MSAFLVTLRLGLHDLFSYRRLALIMSLSIAIATAMVAFLEAYRAGLAAEFNEQTPNLLVVHDIQNVGDIAGSRISSQVAEKLSGMGISMIIPEIRAVTGTSIQNATLLRGIDLAAIYPPGNLLHALRAPPATRRPAPPGHGRRASGRKAASQDRRL